MARFLDRLAVLAGTGLYTGYFPVASGTFGTLVGVVLFILISGSPPLFYWTVVLVVVAAGIWSAGRCERIFGQKDSSQVVIDEIAGYLVAMFAVPAKPGWILAGFVLFRVADVIKPPPAGYADREMKGGTGVMLDDLVAGAYTWLALQAALMLFP